MPPSRIWVQISTGTLVEERKICSNTSQYHVVCSLRAPGGGGEAVAFRRINFNSSGPGVWNEIDESLKLLGLCYQIITALCNHSNLIRTFKNSLR